MTKHKTTRAGTGAGRVEAIDSIRKPNTARCTTQAICDPETSRIAARIRHDRFLDLTVVTPEYPGAETLLPRSTHRLCVLGKPSWSWPRYSRRQS